MTWTSRYFVWNITLISLSLHLRGRVVTKERDIKNFVKSQPPFDVHWQYLDVSDRFTRRKFWGFAVKFLTVLLISQNLARLSPVVVFYKRSAGDCLTFGAIWNQPFRIRFLDISKNMFLRSNSLRKVKLFCMIMKYVFLEVPCSFQILKDIRNYQTLLWNKKLNQSTTLRYFKTGAVFLQQ